MVGGTTESGLCKTASSLVMSTKITGKGKTFSAKVGSSAKSKGASLPTPLDGGSAGNAVKGHDERQHQAPLTAFPAPCPRTPFFQLTEAVVVIDRTTGWSHFGKLETLPPRTNNYLVS